MVVVVRGRVRERDATGGLHGSERDLRAEIREPRATYQCAVAAIASAPRDERPEKDDAPQPPAHAKLSHARFDASSVRPAANPPPRLGDLRTARLDSLKLSSDPAGFEPASCSARWPGSRFLHSRYVDDIVIQ